jgi:hypothetical protein
MSALLVYLGAALALAVSIYPSLANFREDSPANSRIIIPWSNHQKKQSWTKHALIGVLLGFTGFLLTIIGTHLKEKEDSKDQEAWRTKQIRSFKGIADKLGEAQQKSEAIAKNLGDVLGELQGDTKTIGKVLDKADRNLHPLTELAFDAVLTLPQEDPGVRSIKNQVVEFLRREELVHGKMGFNDSSLGWSIIKPYSSDGSPPFHLNTVDIPNSSPLYPAPNTDLFRVISGLELVIDFARDLQKKRLINRAAAIAGNLHLVVGAGDVPRTPLQGPGAETHLQYLINNDLLVVSFTDARSLRKTWKTDGLIMSANDLPSSDLQIKISCLRNSVGAEEYLLGSRFRDFVIHVAGDRDLFPLRPKTVRPVLINHTAIFNLKLRHYR